MCAHTLVLALFLSAVPARAQKAADVVLQNCGSCAWSAAIDRSLLYSQNAFAGMRPGRLLTKSGECAEDCADVLNFRRSNFDLEGNSIAAISDGALSGMPRLKSLFLGNNPIAGLPPSALAGNTALETIEVGGTALGCVPAVGIPVTASILGDGPGGRVPRCPEACSPGTVYNASAAACVACPAGLQPLAPDTVGGVMGMCVPAGWDAIFLTVCGSCAFWRTKPGSVLVDESSSVLQYWAESSSVLVRTGNCAHDCIRGLGGGWGDLDGGRAERLDLSMRSISEISDGALSGLPLVKEIYLLYNPIAGLSPSAFTGNTALQKLAIYRSALSCVPAGGIPATALISLPRCPEACAPGTVYNSSAAACVACPAGLQPLAPGTVGGSLGMCVPAGWDATWLDVCGSCAFWRTKTGSVLVRTGNCTDDCAGREELGPVNYKKVRGVLDLRGRGIAAVSPGVFEGLTGLRELWIGYNNLGCVPGVACNVGVDNQSALHLQTHPRCPSNCIVGTFYDSAGACLPCQKGLTTMGVGAAGAKSCVDPATLLSASSSVTATPGLPVPTAATPAAPNSTPMNIAPSVSKHFVSFTVTLPYTKSEFDTDKQKKFKTAVSSAAEVPAVNVDIVDIIEKRRREGSIDVLTKVLSGART